MKNKKSKYVQLIELYNSGKTNVDELKIELNTTKKTIYTYIYQANKEGKIIKLKKIMNINPFYILMEIILLGLFLKYCNKY